MTLDQVPPGSRATVTAMSPASGEAQRLLEMGLVEGASVEVVRLAPLGDPMEVRVFDYLVTLRKHEARSIEVELA